MRHIRRHREQIPRDHPGRRLPLGKKQDLALRHIGDLFMGMRMMRIWCAPWTIADIEDYSHQIFGGKNAPLESCPELLAWGDLS